MCVYLLIVLVYAYAYGDDYGRLHFISSERRTNEGMYMNTSRVDCRRPWTNWHGTNTEFRVYSLDESKSGSTYQECTSSSLAVRPVHFDVICVYPLRRHQGYFEPCNLTGTECHGLRVMSQSEKYSVSRAVKMDFPNISDS
jgi:hypothetical protein